jgi:hypothetical protein
MTRQCAIGFVSDTHDATDPQCLIATLASHLCDYNVHLGDVGSSPPFMAVVHQFKQHLGDSAHLSPTQRAQFENIVRQGVPRLRAYIEVVLGRDGLARHHAARSAAYRAVFAAMEALQQPIVLQGNVDATPLVEPEVRRLLETCAIGIERWPRLIDLDWLGLLAWPSLRPFDEERQMSLRALLPGLASRLMDKQHLVIFAHENIFKGPGVSTYVERLTRHGLQHTNVPRFDQNPSWRSIIGLCRCLPPTVNIWYVFGHVHDPLSVIATGVPVLLNPHGPGLRYRLHGLGWRGSRHGEDPTLRRTITMLPVAVDEVALLRVSIDCPNVDWQSVRCP